MTVATETCRSTYVTNGATTVFPVTWPFPANGDLVVTYTPDGGDPEILDLDVDYTVSGAGVSAGGSVTALSALATGELEIKRVIALTQSVSFRNQGSFSPALHEAAQDRAIMATQQLEREIADLDTEVTALTARVVAAEAVAAAATAVIAAFNAALATAAGDIDVAALLAAPHTWTAKQTFQSTSAVDPAIAVTNSGGGPAITADCTTTGNGNAVVATGFGTGCGLKGTGGTAGKGVEGYGNGAGDGVYGSGGATGNGVKGVGKTGTSQPGVYGTGGDAGGPGVEGLGAATGPGVKGTGGATSGIGVNGVGGATNGWGVKGTSSGSGRGVSGHGGTTGIGVVGVGGATSGPGFYSSVAGTAGTAPQIVLQGRAAPPSTDLEVGAEYVTSAGVAKVYDGANWVSIGPQV